MLGNEQHVLVYGLSSPWDALPFKMRVYVKTSNCFFFLFAGHFNEDSGYPVEGCSLMKRSLTINSTNAYNVSFETMRDREKRQEENLASLGFNMVKMYYCDFIRRLASAGSPENLFAKSFRRTYYKPWKPRLLLLFKTTFLNIVDRLYIKFRFSVKSNFDFTENFPIGMQCSKNSSN